MTHFFGLLHVAHEHAAHQNLARAADPLAVYVRCAVVCARSAAEQGLPFALITNDRQAIQRHVQGIAGAEIEVLERGFALDVPPGIAFHSAHFKLELYHAFGRGEFGRSVGLVDIDGFFRRSSPRLQPTAELGVYDITPQIASAYGADRVRQDLEAVAGESIERLRWFGGECITGSAAAFAHVSDAVARCWPRYLQNLPRLHHVGDEMVASAALAVAAAEGLALQDLGRDRTVARWWSARTLHRQVRHRDVAGAAFLHLPADKPFIAGHAETTGRIAEALDEAYPLHFKATSAHRRIGMRDIVRRRQHGFKPKL